MPRGGYQKPSNPAAVSGPGALSRRTDGGAGSKQAMQEIRTGKYGESKALMEQQQGAPLAGSPTPNPKVTAQPNRVTPLFAPTQRPNEPVTEGMSFGPGSNSVGAIPTAVNGASAGPRSLSKSLAPLLAYDTSGNIRSLYELAVNRGW